MYSIISHQILTVDFFQILKSLNLAILYLNQKFSSTKEVQFSRG